MTNTDVSQIPEFLYQHIATHSMNQLAPAWIELAQKSERIVQIGGAWHHYFDSKPEVGSNISDSCEILMGMLPTDTNFELPQIQLVNDCYTDISVLHAQGRDWLLFCDVTENTLQIQRYQQTSNDLVLLKAKLNQTLARYVGQEVADRAANGSLQFDIDGERKRISTLFVDIRGFTPFNETHDAQVVMQTLNAYMDCMLTPILNSQGIVDKIIGDGVMGVFGVIDSETNCAQNAFSAALKMLESTAKLNQERKAQQLEQLGIGIGIATGDAVLGLLGSHDRRAFTAIGRHVNLAARLESNAKVGELLIDTESFNTLSNPSSFTSVSLSLKGIGTTDAYSHIVGCIS